jgi:hypothetical protein
MATAKQMDKRLAKVEDWLKAFDKSTGAKTTMDNMNWLVGQLRALGGRMQEMEGQMQMMDGQLSQNHQAVDEFLNENDLIMDWRIFLEKKNKEAEDAVQESETKKMDVQEQARDGEEMGSGDPEGDEAPDQS